MTAEVRRRPPLQAEADRCGRVYVGERAEIERGVCGRKVQARGSPGRSARGQLSHHVAWHSLHVGQFSTRGTKTAAWPADTSISASALLRTFAIATPRVKTIRRGSRASPGHQGNGKRISTTAT